MYDGCMFIRKTKNTHPKTKKEYFVYQLVESVRTERGPRQRIILSLGSDLGVSDEDLKLLANRIEEIFLGTSSLLPYPDEIERLAQQYASQLIHRLSKSDMPESPPLETEYQSIDIQTIEQQEPRTVGAEHLALYFASQLQLAKKLCELGFSEREIALSLGTIIGRAVFPASERATHEWLSKRSGLGELIDFDFQNTPLNQLYKISDRLLEHKETLEKHLECTQQAIHGYKSTMVLYDLTNTYMEGQAKGNGKARHGVSKENRTDCPLVTLGLVVNEHGFATRSAFLPGNISEPETLQQMVKALNHYCESEAKRAVATQMKEAFQRRFEADLTKMQEGLAKPKGRKKYPKILERIGRLREKHKRVSGCYEITVEASDDGKMATAIQWSLNPEKLEDRLNGYYFLRTNLIHLGPEALWELYDSIRTVEDAFRFMKSSLGMRPVYHQKEHRVDGHLWITILAYHLIQACLYQLRRQGISHLWQTVRNRLSTRMRVTIRAQTKEKQTFYHRSTTKAEEGQRQIYQALGLTTQILKSVKTLA